MLEWSKKNTKLVLKKGSTKLLDPIDILRQGYQDPYCGSIPFPMQGKTKTSN